VVSLRLGALLSRFRFAFGVQAFGVPTLGDDREQRDRDGRFQRASLVGQLRVFTLDILDVLREVEQLPIALGALGPEAFT
jgi:hypothetical protein